ncbi:hypothetical protein AMAG_02960 [Allomyces macrogynus ATCC 38327]|uniref:Uncharacterized protein n=1 Tax=Allomyces macrogynus (strain ATCC 38327) TaxID=578462 RepID=A0A0L0S4C9_ALLM3|nr:hypothetical protein AMAG_02960 [Allomyces macrogynus ATCC 38327]|eukprot:KNE57224.1 hypothetical protein AMAG_02960 [Allomyces macrogynus ATCC 38327]
MAASTRDVTRAESPVSDSSLSTCASPPRLMEPDLGDDTGSTSLVQLFRDTLHPVVYAEDQNEAVDPHPDFGAVFGIAAASMMHDFVLVAMKDATSTPRFFSITELEFYLTTAAHPDPFARRTPITNDTAKWYWHPSGGSRKGLDVTFGISPAQKGGILIRGLLTQDGEHIRGPSRCVDAIFAIFGVSRVKEVQELLPHLDADPFDSSDPILAPFLALIPRNRVDEMLAAITGSPQDEGRENEATPLRAADATIEQQQPQRTSPYFASAKKRRADTAAPDLDYEPRPKRLRSSSASLSPPAIATPSNRNRSAAPRPTFSTTLPQLDPPTPPIYASPRVGLVPKLVPATTTTVAPSRSGRIATRPALPVQMYFAFAPYRYLLFPHTCIKKHLMFMGTADASDLALRPTQIAQWTAWFAEGQGEDDVMALVRAVGVGSGSGNTRAWFRLFGHHRATANGSAVGEASVVDEE